MSDTQITEKVSSKYKTSKRPAYQIISPAKSHDKAERSSSFNNKTVTKANTLSKSSLEVRKCSDDELIRMPKKILKYKSVSPQKAFKRLQSLGGTKKQKNVAFKELIKEVKCVPSLTNFIYNSKQFPNENMEDLSKAKCTCACMIY